ncbi:PhoH-like protein [Fundidesulfovibrio magnetotacticus]|uniref:PhoH-like protein n=1 Tax=Fundidesulfovibrio magnetotacticus TaxID=2730080 RepID=A0A6V8M3U2_9BACT|nr:PhoH family protein [Fundidesulfovibrio magnetotacticus]GFK95105.1 PhoH-like protein [Fundidesulfovibrio magnetotacticus]
MPRQSGFARKLEFDDPELARDLFGPHNANLAFVSEKTGVHANSRGAVLTLRGETVELIDQVAEAMVRLYGMLKKGVPVYPRDIEPVLGRISRDPDAPLAKVFEEDAFLVAPKKTITPRTFVQREYLGAIRSSDLTFGIGPAGTGKTYLAVAAAVGDLLARRVKRLILTRPAVEAGEKLGFLPGDLAEKVNPYLRPLYDALHDMLDYQRVAAMLAEGVIEVAPLAFMRGRTLNDAFIILDEAQNTTPEQMKMFLTRIGFGSKAVVTGDVTQVDLPRGAPSGLIEARRVLAGVQGLTFVTFTEEDVIRHPLVGRIVQAYERHTQPPEEA